MDLIQQQDSQLFKMAVNDENELNSLLAYYRDRINDFDKERQEWLQKLEELRFKQDEKHKSEWELRKRTDEIVELQRSLSEAKVTLFDERKQFLNKVKECDQLKLKQLEDKQKIQELLSITEAVEENVVLTRDLRPEVTTRYPNNDLNIYKNSEKQLKKMSVTTRSGATSTGGKNIVKTIYMPNEELNHISLENGQLKQQMKQQEEAYQQEIDGLREELRLRDQDARIKFNVDAQTIQDLQQKCQNFEKKFTDISKEYFHQKVKFSEEERKLQEENELLRLRNTALAQKLAILQKQSDIEIKVGQSLAEKKAEEYANKFKIQVKQKEENIQIIKEQYSKVQQIYLDKMKTLENHLSNLTNKYQILENKRLNEIEGFKHEIRRLQAELQKYDKMQLTLQQQYAGAKKQEEFMKSHTSFKQTEPIKKRNQQYNSTHKDDFDPLAQSGKSYASSGYNNMSSLDDETVNLSELEEIKNQLLELEEKLDIAKKTN